MAYNSTRNSRTLRKISIASPPFSPVENGSPAEKRKFGELDSARDRARELGHDLRTPLNAIIGFSEMLLAGTVGDVENERHREYLEYVQRSGLELLETVRNLLEESDDDEAAGGNAPPRCI